MPKPPLSAAFDPANPLSIGPFYGLLEGAGASSADDAPAAAPALTLTGGAAWAKPVGFVVRTAAVGDFLSAPDAPALQRPSTALTVVLAFNPGAFAGNQPPRYLAKEQGYGNCTYGFSARTNGGRSVRGEITVGGAPYYSPDVGPAYNLPVGTAFLAVLRWRSGADLDFRLYNRATGALIPTASAVGTVNSGGTTQPAPAGALSYSARPLHVGFTEATGDNPTYAFGDYEFAAVADRRWTDAETDAFALNPYQNFTATATDYALKAGSTTVTPGTPLALTVTLNSPPASGATVSFTPAVTGMTGLFSPATPTITGPANSAAFTFTPDASTPNNTAGSLATTNNGGLRNPAALAFRAVYGPPATLPTFNAMIGRAAATGSNPYPAYPVVYVNADDHYDTPRIFQQVRDYTGDPGWDRQIAASVDHYRDQAVFVDGGAEQGHHAWATGLRMHFDRTGDGKSRDAAILLSLYAAAANDGAPYFNGAFQNTSREVAFSVVNKLEVEKLGCVHRTFAERQVQQALGHIDQWLSPPGSRYWATFVRPFMTALTCEALIKYWDRWRGTVSTGPNSIGDLVSRIPGAVRAIADYNWLNLWVPSGSSVFIDETTTVWPYGAFRYTDVDTSAASSNAVHVAVNDPSPTAVAFKGPASLSTQNDYYKFTQVRFTSGALNQQQCYCSGYDGATRTLHFDYVGYGGNFTGAPANGDAFALIQGSQYDDGTGTGNGTGSGGTGVASDLNLLIAPIYARLYEWTVSGVLPGGRDNGYRAKHDAVFDGSSASRNVVGTQKVYNQSYRLSFQGLKWRAQGDSPWPAATALTLTPPATTTGAVNALSGPFTAALSGVNVSVPAPLAIALSDGGSGGTFFPAAVVLTTDMPAATFRYRPASTGAKTISLSNPYPLTPNPQAIYTVSGAVPFAVSYVLTPSVLTGPPGAPVSVAASLTPAGAVPPPSADVHGALVTLDGSVSSNGGFGYNGNPPMGRIWFSGDEPFPPATFTPASVGTASIRANNDAGLTDPAAVAFTVAAQSPATSYTLSGPSSGAVGVSSAPFTVAPNGSYRGTITVTPGGGLAPVVLTFNGAAPPQTFTITPTSTTILSLAATSSPALTNPAPPSYSPVASRRPHRFLVHRWPRPPIAS